MVYLIAYAAKWYAGEQQSLPWVMNSFNTQFMTESYMLQNKLYMFQSPVRDNHFAHL